MPKVVAARPQVDSHLWKVQFSDTVIAMCPELNPDAADEASDAEVAHALLSDPVAAARRWVARRFARPRDARERG
jgi:hypothetical protein